MKFKQLKTRQASRLSSMLLFLGHCWTTWRLWCGVVYVYSERSSSTTNGTCEKRLELAICGIVKVTHARAYIQLNCNCLSSV